MVKVSVIVPVYNVEEYLSKCLESLVNQTLEDIEIIVVNDGTKDNSQKIIDKYSKKYPNKIKSFIKENGGLSSARNYGLKYATGEYIGFVDSDDWVELDMYEKMYNKAVENNFDIVVCDLFYYFEDVKKKASSNIKSDIKDDDVKKSMLNIYPAAWNKIYHNKLFKHNVMFKEKVWYEDVEFMYRLYPHIHSVGVISEPLYDYRQREGAITKTFDERVFNYIENWNGIIEYYKKNNLFSEYKKELEYCYVRYIYATFIKTALNFDDKEKYYTAVETAIRNVKSVFPKYRHNKYFYMSPKGIFLLVFNKHISKIMYFFKKWR